MKSVDDVVAELRLQIAKNLARDVGIVSIDCEDALALCQMAADFAVLLAEGKRAISALQREADGLREALEQISLFAGPTLPRYENAVNIIRDIQYVARAALNGSPQETATEGSDL